MAEGCRFRMTGLSRSPSARHRKSYGAAAKPGLMKRAAAFGTLDGLPVWADLSAATHLSEACHWP